MALSFGGVSVPGFEAANSGSVCIPANRLRAAGIGWRVAFCLQTEFHTEGTHQSACMLERFTARTSFHFGVRVLPLPPGFVDGFRIPLDIDAQLA